MNFQSLLSEWLAEIRVTLEHRAGGQPSFPVGTGDPSVFELAAALYDEDPESRQRAIRALGALGSADAVQALAKALHHPDPDARVAAAQALGQLGQLESVALADGRREPGAAGGSSGEPPAPAPHRSGSPGSAVSESVLLAALADIDAGIREWAAGELARRGGAVLEPMRATLRGGPILAREMAAQVLGKLGDPRVVPDLLSALQEPSGRTRAAAALALAELGAGDAMDSLILMLGDEDLGARRAAVAALRILNEGFLANAVQDALAGVPGAVVALDDERAVGPLLRALGHSDSSLCWAAADALGALRETRACRPLVALLDDGRPRLRDAAARALVRIGEPSVAPLRAALADGSEALCEGTALALRQIAPEILLAVLDEDGPSARAAAVRALGEWPDPRAVPALIRAIQDASPLARRAAAEALCHRRCSAAAEPLAHVLDDADPEVCLAAAAALCALGAAAGGALDALHAHARCAPDAAVRQACREAARAIEDALKDAPAELEAAATPRGRGTEPEAAMAPQGRGTEPEAALEKA